MQIVEQIYVAWCIHRILQLLLSHRSVLRLENVESVSKRGFTYRNLKWNFEVLIHQALRLSSRLVLSDSRHLFSDVHELSIQISDIVRVYRLNFCYNFVSMFYKRKALALAAFAPLPFFQCSLWFVDRHHSTCLFCLLNQFVVFYRFSTWCW